MTLEKRVDNLEKRIDSLIKSINLSNFYGNADLSGIQKGVNDITPFTVSKKAYYGENYKTFYDVPDGNVTVYFDNYDGVYSLEKIEDRLIVSFDALEHETQITISII